MLHEEGAVSNHFCNFLKSTSRHSLLQRAMNGQLCRSETGGVVWVYLSGSSPSVYLHMVRSLGSTLAEQQQHCPRTVSVQSVFRQSIECRSSMFGSAQSPTYNHCRKEWKFPFKYEKPYGHSAQLIDTPYKGRLLRQYIWNSIKASNMTQRNSLLKHHFSSPLHAVQLTIWGFNFCKHVSQSDLTWSASLWVFMFYLKALSSNSAPQFNAVDDTQLSTAKLLINWTVLQLTHTHNTGDLNLGCHGSFPVCWHIKYLDGLNSFECDRKTGYRKLLTIICVLCSVSRKLCP